MHNHLRNLRADDQSPRRWSVTLCMIVCCGLALFAAACSSDGTSVETGESASSTAAQDSQDDGDGSSDGDTSSDDGPVDAEDNSAKAVVEGSGDNSDNSDNTGDEDEKTDDNGDGEAGPLAEFMGWDSNDSDDFVEQERQIERAVQSCMAEQGFEYNPRDVSNDQFFSGGWPGEGLSDEEYAAQYGFGASTTFDEVFDVGSAEEGAGAYKDPNEDVLSVMSDSERDAWQFALWGVPPEFDAEGNQIDPDTGEAVDGFAFSGPEGCYGEAQADVYGDWAVLDSLNDEFEELYQRIEADPRIAELNEAWSECMAEAGHQFETQSDMWDAVYAPFEQFQQEVFSSFGPGPDMDEADFENLTDAELEAFYAPPALTLEQEATLADLQDYEIDVAVASQACEPGDDTTDVWLEVSSEYESQFIEENRSVLESARGG